LQTRKRYRVKRKDPNAAAVEAAATSAAAAAPPPNPQLFTGFSFNVAGSTSSVTNASPSKPDAAASEKVAQADEKKVESSVAVTPDKSSSEVKAPAFDFKATPAFTFTSTITPTTASSSAAAKDGDAPTPAFQFSSSFTNQASANPFKFSFPLASSAAPDMQVQPNAGAKFVGVSTFQSQAPLSLFGKDIAKPAEPVGGLNAPSAAENGKETEDAEDPEASVPTVVLAPSVTGEEDEETLFQEKCKLYEFDKEAKSWVEKGKGVLKLNKHKISSKVRVLMRTEPAHRLAINGVLLAGVKVSVDSKRPKVASLTLPATYVMGHESSAASEMCVLSLRFMEDSHGAAFVDLAQPYVSDKTAPATAPQQEKTDQ
jgi:hypothetical protein